MKFRLAYATAILSALLLVPALFAQQPDSKPGQDSKTTSAPADISSQNADQGSKPADPGSPPPGQSSKPSDPGATTPPNSTPPTLPPTTAPSDEKKDDTAKEPAPAIVQQPDDSKVKHDGSKNDVNAIGNRKVGGRGLGDWYSLEGEIRMGKQYAQEVEATSKLIRDPVITEYVNRIGQNLVRNSDAQVPFTIKVIDSDEVNAFALPGGFFYVNSGLILAAVPKFELIGVGPGCQGQQLMAQTDAKNGYVQGHGAPDVRNRRGALGRIARAIGDDHTITFGLDKVIVPGHP